MDERLRFVALLPEGDKMAGLCRKSGVSRGIGYQNHRRGRDIGPEALTEHSLTPSLDRPGSEKSDGARHRRPMAALPRGKRHEDQGVRSGGQGRNRTIDTRIFRPRETEILGPQAEDP